MEACGVSRGAQAFKLLKPRVDRRKVWVGFGKERVGWLQTSVPSVRRRILDFGGTRQTNLIMIPIYIKKA
jgi:hypothetical protein